MTKQFDWIPDSNLKTQILKAWEEYQLDPQAWRLNNYLTLIYEVPIDDNLDYINFEDPKYDVPFGNTHQPSLRDCW